VNTAVQPLTAFVYDLKLGAAMPVASADIASAAGISDNGRFVVLQGPAFDTGTDTQSNIFVTDRETGSHTVVSRRDANTPPDGASTHPAISGDGALIGFTSAADNLIDNDTNGGKDVFVVSNPTSASATTLLSAETKVNKNAVNIALPYFEAAQFTVTLKPKTKGLRAKTIHTASNFLTVKGLKPGRWTVTYKTDTLPASKPATFTIAE
jgi:hypothetical protein